VRLLGWLSWKTTTSSPCLRSSPLDTMLFASLVLRVMTISSGVTRRNAASVLRRLSFSPLNRARFCPEGSRSTLSLSRFSASSTGRDAGQRFAAFRTPRSSGITNCARTDFQKASPEPDSVGENDGACACSFAHTGSAKSAAEPPMANRRAKSRRDTDWAMNCLRADSTRKAPIRGHGQRARVRLRASMNNRREFLRLAGAAGAYALAGRAGLQGQTPRREVTIGGRRVRVIDAHAHCVIPVQDVV